MSGPVDLSWTVEGVGDFNEDRCADILWRRSDGILAIWLMNGGLYAGDASTLPYVSPAVRLASLLSNVPPPPFPF